MNQPIALAVALLVFANLALATESNGVLSAEGPLALREAQASALFDQCSRRAPKPERRLWFPILWYPTAADVKALEAQLEKYMRSIELGAPGAPAAGEQYRGQYAGFTRGKVKYIYAAYIPASFGEGLKKYVQRGDAIHFCDGGSHFWGIVYNTATGQFSELEVDGR